MKHNCKRFLSLLLALVMVLGMMPVGHAHAEVETVLVIGDLVTAVCCGHQFASYPFDSYPPKIMEKRPLSTLKSGRVFLMPGQDDRV